MSAALVRQALELFDDDEREGNARGKKNKPSRHHRSSGQDHRHLYKKKSKKATKVASKSSDEIVEENLRKLLALSQPASQPAIAEKIVERAVKGKALTEKIEIKTEEPKSILFPEETFEDFEKEYFCK